MNSHTVENSWVKTIGAAGNFVCIIETHIQSNSFVTTKSNSKRSSHCYMILLGICVDNFPCILTFPRNQIVFGSVLHSPTAAYKQFRWEISEIMIAVVSTPNPHSVRMSELVSEMEKRERRGWENVPEKTLREHSYRNEWFCFCCHHYCCLSVELIYQWGLQYNYNSMLSPITDRFGLIQFNRHDEMTIILIESQRRTIARGSSNARNNGNYNGKRDMKQRTGSVLIGYFALCRTFSARQTESYSILYTCKAC